MIVGEQDVSEQIIFSCQRINLSVARVLVALISGFIRLFIE